MFSHTKQSQIGSTTCFLTDLILLGCTSSALDMVITRLYSVDRRTSAGGLPPCWSRYFSFPEVSQVWGEAAGPGTSALPCKTRGSGEGEGQETM